jgi:hypothetical protein
MKDDFSENFQRGYIGLAKIISCFNTEIKEFNKNTYMYTAKIARELNPELSIPDLAQLTGIYRDKLSDLLKGEKLAIPPDKTSVVLAELWKNRDKDGYVPYKGKGSFFSITKVIVNSHYSPSTMLNVLIKLNAVEFDDDRIKILSNKIVEFQKTSFMINVLAKSIDRLVDNIIDNINNCEKYQNTILTTKVNPKYFKQLHKELTQELRKVVASILNIIESYEDEYGEYPEYGLSIFEFFKNPKR